MFLVSLLQQLFSENHFYLFKELLLHDTSTELHCLLFVNHTRPHMKSHACYTTLSFHTTVTAIYCTWFSTVFILGYLNLVLELHNVRKTPPSFTKFSITSYLTLNRFTNFFCKLHSSDHVPRTLASYLNPQQTFVFETFLIHQQDVN